MSLLFFIIVSGVISYIDIKKGLILDTIMFPSFFILLALKYLENSLSTYDFIAVMIILVIFIIPIILNFSFGGGDLRFGAFCALFVGLAPLGYFVIFSGVTHLLILTVLRKKSFAFAPAMTVGAITAYLIGV
jgi:prepilin signal peptidase PulO-like enzyme (type II secretory pathway)